MYTHTQGQPGPPGIVQTDGAQRLRCETAPSRTERAV